MDKCWLNEYTMVDRSAEGQGVSLEWQRPRPLAQQLTVISGHDDCWWSKGGMNEAGWRRDSGDEEVRWCPERGVSGLRVLEAK